MTTSADPGITPKPATSRRTTAALLTGIPNEIHFSRRILNRATNYCRKFIGKKPEMTLAEAFARYWMERGKDLPTANIIKRMSLALEAGLGQHTPLSAVTKADLITYSCSRLARRKHDPETGKQIVAQRGPVTVNKEIRFLSRILNRATNLWEVEVAKINLKDILLPEPAYRQHILTAIEEERLFQALRPDLHAMVRFALLTGVRLSNVVTLRWRQVNSDAGHIVFYTKSKKPGGEVHYVPISKAVNVILLGEQGRHPDRVFTFLCANTNPRLGYQKGRRYPIWSASRRGWRRSWEKALLAAGLRYGQGDRENFRFHDLRHTAATRALKATGNLKTVQHLLGHTNITTTTRYARTDVEDVRQAIDPLQK